jgi:hypothetical protein
VTADQCDPNNMRVVGTVNGEVRQDSNTNDMVFNCAQIISYTSKLFTLEPGDIIYTGTPEGVISGYPKEKQVWLKPGDRLETAFQYPDGYQPTGVPAASHAHGVSVRAVEAAGDGAVMTGPSPAGSTARTDTTHASGAAVTSDGR